MSTTSPRTRGARALCLALVLAFAAACRDGTGSGNPLPTIQSLDPSTLLQYTDSTIITVTGTGFVDGAVVHVDGSPRLTGYVSPSQVVAIVPRAAMEEAGTRQVTVVNPAPGGGASAPSPLHVFHRVPTMFRLDPEDALQGDTAVTLRVLGFGFARASVVKLNGAERPTTFVSPSELRVRLPASDLAQVGTTPVTVFTPAPGGGASDPRLFSVRVRPNPIPRATALSPDFVVADVGGQITLTGSSFMEGTTVTVGGVMPTPTLVSSTELRFTLAGENVPNAGFAEVYVSNPTPGGGPSNVLSLRVVNPLPVLTALSPAQALVGLDSMVLRLTGSGFVRQTEVRVQGWTRPSRRIGPTEMEVVLGPYDLDMYRTLPVQVVNAAPGGGSSAELSLEVVNPAPVANVLVPAQATAGADSLVVRVTGSGFSRLTAVHFQGSPRPTRFVSATELEAVLAAEDLDEPGTFAVTAVTPAPGGGSSAPLALTLDVPAPVLTDLPSYGASAGRSGFPLVVHGTGFLRTSVVQWNGQARVTRYISSSRLEVNVTGADVAAPGTGAVTVHTPGGGTSAAKQVTIRPVGPATFSDSLTVDLPAEDIVYDPRANRIYASLGAGAGARANSVVAISPHTGEVTGSVALAGGPARLALSDDGSTLWVALDGTGQVRRLSLPGLTPGTVFSLGTDRVEDMEVMPGRPGTVAIALRNQCCTPGHEGVAIYDDGARRAVGTPGHTGSNQIAFGESASVLYGQSTEGGGFFTMHVGPGGVSIVRSTGLDRLGWTMEYGGGRVYTSLGGIIDAGRHELVGDVAPQAQGYALAVDVVTGRAFYARETFEGGTTVRIFDLNTLQLLGEMDPGTAFIRRLVRWGTDGLALTDGTRIRIFRMPIVGP